MINMVGLIEDSFLFKKNDFEWSEFFILEDT